MLHVFKLFYFIIVFMLLVRVSVELKYIFVVN